LLETTDHIHSLHRREEELRVRSLAAIKARVDLSDHFTLINEAMNVIHAFFRDRPYESDDELTLQLLGIRLFNSTGASIRLALSGYYRQSFDQLRDVLETHFLVDYFRSNPEEIEEWRSAGKRQRMGKFGIAKIRAALDRRDGYTTELRQKIYDRIADYASHASQPDFRLVTGHQNLGEAGPFYDERKLAVWATELATRLGHAVLVLVSADAERSDQKLLVMRKRYLRAMDNWLARYLTGQ
jgi:hypothetical protein